MVKKLSSLLTRISTPLVAAAGAALFLLFMVLVLPGQAEASRQEVGDAPSPDTSLTYSPGELYQMAEGYGEQGRRAYIRTRFTFDLIFPLVYGFFLVTAISWASRHFFPSRPALGLTNLIPLAGVLFDYLENISTSLVMGAFPSRLPAVPILAPAFTLLKWLWLGLSFLVLLGIFLAGLFRKINPGEPPSPAS